MARHLRTEGLDPARALPRESLPRIEFVPFPDPNAPLDDDDLGDPLEPTDDDASDGVDGGRRRIGWLLPTMAVTAVITAVALAAVALIDPAPGSARNRPVVAGTSIERSTTVPSPTQGPPGTHPTRPAPSSIPPLTSTPATVAPTTPPATVAPTTPPATVPPTTVPVETLYRDPAGAFTVMVDSNPRRSTRPLTVDGSAMTQAVTTVDLRGGGQASIDVLSFAFAGRTTAEIDQAMRNYATGTRSWGGSTPSFSDAVAVEGWRQIDGTAGRYRLRVFAAADRLHLVWTATSGADFDRLLGSYRPAV